MIRLFLCFLIALLLHDTALCEDVKITLRNGDVFTAELLEADDEGITVKRHFTMANGKQASAISKIAHTQIKTREKLSPYSMEYSQKVLKAKTADDHFAIAQWAESRQKIDDALYHAKKALSIDPTHASALAMMENRGLTLHEGEWIPKADALAKAGKTEYAGQVVSKDEAMRLRIADALRLRTRQLEQQLKDALESLPKQEAKLGAFQAELRNHADLYQEQISLLDQLNADNRKLTTIHEKLRTERELYAREKSRVTSQLGYTPPEMSERFADISAREAAAKKALETNNANVLAGSRAVSRTAKKITDLKGDVDLTNRRARGLVKIIRRCQESLGIDTLTKNTRVGSLGTSTATSGGYTYHGIDSRRLLDIKARGHGEQEKSMWCWAAAVQVAFESYGYSIEQQNIVEKVRGYAVNAPANGIDILTALGAFQSDENDEWKLADGTMVTTTFRHREATTFSPAELLHDCKNGHPTLLALGNAQWDIGHAVTIIGCTENASGQLVSVRYWEVANGTLKDVPLPELLANMSYVFMLRVIEW